MPVRGEAWATAQFSLRTGASNELVAMRFATVTVHLSHLARPSCLLCRAQPAVWAPLCLPALNTGIPLMAPLPANSVCRTTKSPATL
eukprot:360572-Chlamydomonas_euryale.AAC.7